jgi:hypothetical protein
VLTKEFKFVPPPADADDKPDENGITNANIDFSWEKDVKIGVSFSLSLFPWPVFADTRGVVPVVSPLRQQKLIGKMPKRI